MRICALILGLIAVGVPLGAQAPVRPSADALAAALQRRYATVRNFSADFVHIYEGGALRLQATERGAVLIKKPGKMRWRYDDPEAKLFVSDGETIYAYLPADRQVRVSAMPSPDRASAAVLFLVGQGDLTRDFVARDASVDEPAGTYTLTLTPLDPNQEYESLTLVVDRVSLELRQLVSTDHQGGTSTFRFTHLDENIGLSDAEFSFTIPRDADVITSDQRPG